jgi:hypothetical protein
VPERHPSARGLALLRSWWGQQLALKLAHDFALRLDQLHKLLIRKVVKLAWLADFFLLGEEVQFNERASTPL